jgi:soluble lytic murein transglycosylase-like protein
MTTMIRRGRGTAATLILTAVLMSLPTATTTRAAIQRDTYRAVPARLCPIDWRESTWHVKRLIKCAAAHYGISREKALYVAWRESRYRPSAYNRAGPAAGIYQHLTKYWPDRAEEFGFGDSSAFNARANIIVTMRMVLRFGWDPWGG